MELPEQIEAELILGIIRQYSSSSQGKELKEWLKTELHNLVSSYIEDFRIKQKNLREQLVREQLEYLKIDSQKTELGLMFNKAKQKWLDDENVNMKDEQVAEKAFFSSMRVVAKEEFKFIYGKINSLIDFLIDKKYKIYEIEQIFKNLGLIEQNISDSLGEEGIEEKKEQPGEYKSIAELEKAGIHPITNIIKWAMGIVGQVFEKGKKFEGKIILIEEEQETKKKVEVPDDVTKVIYRIDRENKDFIDTMFGTVIGVLDGRTIRVKKQGNNMVFYSKAGLRGIPKTQIMALFMEAFSSGLRSGAVKVGSVIAFAKETDATKEAIQNRITNAAINGVQRAEVEVSLDLSDIKNIGSTLEQKCENIRGQSTTTIILNASQLDKYGSEINKLRAIGFRFILRGTIDEIEDAFENPNFKLDGAILEKVEKIGDIDKLEDLAANNTEGTLLIETRMYVNMVPKNEEDKTTQINIDINEIYNNKGIIPIVNAAQAESMTGKYAIGFKEFKIQKGKKGEKKVDNYLLINLFSKGNILNIFCSDKEGELEQVRKGLSGIFGNIFGTMNELLKPKSPEQRITEETVAVSDYNFGEDFENMETMETLKEIIINDLMSKDGIIKKILTEENVADEKTVEKLLIEFRRSSIHKDLPPVMQMRIETEMQEWKFFEAIGTIRGFVNQVIDQAILSKYEGSKREDYLKKEYKEYRQYMRIRTIQLIMSGENLSDLLELRPDTNQTVEELFDSIRIEVNKDVRKTIIANKVAIKEISDKEKETAKTNFMNINVLMEENLRPARGVKQLEISAQAVRSILAAA